MFKTNALDNVANAYVDKNVGASIPGTRIEADDQNIKQDELVNAVEGTGQTLDAAGVFTNNDQLLKAILSVMTGMSGLIVSNNSGNPDTDIDLSIGQALDSAKAEILKLSSSTTKDLSAVFAAGSGNGGFYQGGGLATDETYYGFIIKKDSDSSIDIYVDISSSAANIPSGYTAYRRIGYVVTDGSGDILPFSAIEISGGSVKITWDAQSNDISATAPTASTPLTLQAPPNSIARFTVLYANNATAYAWLQETTQPDVIPSTANFHIQTSSGSDADVQEFERLVDGSSQIDTRATGAGSGWFVNTSGYTDRRIS